MMSLAHIPHQATPAASAQTPETFRLEKFIKPEHLTCSHPATHNTMRRAIRLDRSANLLRPRPATVKTLPYLCSSCTSQVSSFSTSSLRPADKKLPITERLRRRIWGTDQPPGQEDPYTRMPAGDRTSKRVQQVKSEALEGQRTRITMADLDPSYEPATTWEGLERVGGFGHWWKENWDPEHRYEGFLPSDMAKDKDSVTAALRRAMVEVFALREAGIPLSEISKAVSELDPTGSVQIVPTATGATLQFSSTTSLDDIIQSLTPAATEIDETAVKGNPSESEADVAADRSTVDPLHPKRSVEVDETAVKKNPSESEADVAADRSSVDPLHHESVGIDETKVKGNPSESEADVAADRSTVDPLRHESLESSDRAWLEVSLEDPEVKFAVGNFSFELFATG
jgi:hypothetical protein